MNESSATRLGIFFLFGLLLSVACGIQLLFLLPLGQNGSTTGVALKYQHIFTYIRSKQIRCSLSKIKVKYCTVRQKLFFCYFLLLLKSFARSVTRLGDILSLGPLLSAAGVLLISPGGVIFRLISSSTLAQVTTLPG